MTVHDIKNVWIEIHADTRIDTMHKLKIKILK